MDVSAHPARQPGHCHARDLKSAKIYAAARISAQKIATRGSGSDRASCSDGTSSTDQAGTRRWAYTLALKPGHAARHLRRCHSLNGSL